MKKYAIYKSRDISAMSLSQVREVAARYGIADASTRSKGSLRWEIINHPSNLSDRPVVR